MGMPREGLGPGLQARCPLTGKMFGPVLHKSRCLLLGLQAACEKAGDFSLLVLSLAFSSHSGVILEGVQSGRCGAAEMVLEVSV